MAQLVTRGVNPAKMNRRQRRRRLSVERQRGGARAAWLLGAAALGSVVAPSVARAAPQGAQVVAGQVNIASQGATTTIQASNGAIIKYSSFNIAPGETVRFVQPGAAARVLNRIEGARPTTIEGSLTANGVVYLVNPAGVYFANGAVINTAGLYAAAGHLSDSNFAAGVDRFEQLGGAVSNAGAIHASAVHLLGERVANAGSISAEGGVVTMVAGRDVYLREAGGKVLVRVDGTELTDRSRPASGAGPADMTGTAGVENSGTVEASRGRVVLGAGDLYSLAVRNSGRVSAAGGNLTVAAANGAVVNTATGGLSAGGGGAGDAGRVTVQAPYVVNQGLIEADAGMAGAAGHVEVTSDRGTYLLDGSEISASGHASGQDGGSVLVHSYHGLTVFSSGATLDVSGGAAGAGGFAEVSGEALLFNGSVNLGGEAPGSLLIDPRDIVIADTGTHDGLFNAGVIDFNSPTAGTDITVSDEAIEAINGAIKLQASRDLFVNHPIDLTQNQDLTLEANGDLAVNAAITGARRLTLTADADGSGAGTLSVGAPINVTGPATFTGEKIDLGADVTSVDLQRYVGPVELFAHVTLRASGVRFEGSVDSGLTEVEVFNLEAPPSLAANVAYDLTVHGAALFDGPVGDASALGSIAIHGDTTFQGGPVTTLGPQDYHGSVTVASDAVLTATQAHFFDTIDGATGAERLTVQGDAIIDETVGDPRPLGTLTVTGTTQLNGGFVHTTSHQDYQGAVTLGSNNVLLSDTGGVRFGSALDGGFDLDVFAQQGVIQLGGTAGGLAPLTTLDLFAGPLIEINGALVRATGDIRMNPDGKGVVPAVATIAAPDGGVRVVSDTGGFTVGPNEKITAVGPLTIEAATTVTIGDMNSLGDMTVTAAQIVLRSRPAGTLLDSSGGTVADTGVDLVTGGRFVFSTAPTVLGSEPAPRFGSPITDNPDVSGTLAGIGVGVERIAALTAGEFTFEGTVLDLRVVPVIEPPIEPPPEEEFDLAEALPGGPVPFRDRVLEEPLVGPPGQAALARMAIDSRALRALELVEALTGRHLYDDLTLEQAAAPADGPERAGPTVALNRIRRANAQELIADFQALVDGELASGAATQAADAPEAGRQAMADAWRSYVAEAGGKPTFAGFRAYLAASPERAEALASVRRIDGLAHKAELAGLTPLEVERVRAAVMGLMVPATAHAGGMGPLTRLP